MNRRRLRLCLKRRTNGLLKKVTELAVLTGTRCYLRVEEEDQEQQRDKENTVATIGDDDEAASILVGIGRPSSSAATLPPAKEDIHLLLCLREGRGP